ncbi:hypothetical protein HYH03_012775 [Edaphochlamys debaryana]|uniref:Mitochondrial import inner membrane translocase subunit Tim21 n=1 Tax=Edaphochlamys debaryana TaxID=47281 RepID=A0A835XR92_9CHLO|nr:hypothetical protein HYH03_012775 [Edaphochlamys debaryana]|eukprot:KAG2488778.1 hypothetical protein HYH03_012775 [Edaphochlamys debaryana]
MHLSRRVPQLLCSAVTLAQAEASSASTSAARLGDALRQGLSLQQRLFSGCVASQQGLIGLSALCRPQQPLGLPGLRQFAAAAGNAQQQPKGDKEQYDSLELTQEKIDSITDKIPQRPVGVVEGTSYTLIIIAAFGALAFVLYHVLTSLIFEPTALTAFNHTLERLKADPRITVRIGGADDIRAWGSNSESRVARQQIPHQIYKDANGVEHVRIQFFIKGPSGTGLVNADMYKDAAGGWQYTYLVVDAYPASGGSGGAPQRLALITSR